MWELYDEIFGSFCLLLKRKKHYLDLIKLIYILFAFGLKNHLRTFFIEKNKCFLLEVLKFIQGSFLFNKYVIKVSVNINNMLLYTIYYIQVPLLKKY